MNHTALKKCGFFHVGVVLNIFEVVFWKTCEKALVYNPFGVLLLDHKCLFRTVGWK